MKDFLKNKQFYIDVVVIVLGCFISSLGVNLFLSNAQLLSGGVTGIGLILQYLFEIPSGITVFILNIPSFLNAFIFFVNFLNKP